MFLKEYLLKLINTRLFGEYLWGFKVKGNKKIIHNFFIYKNKFKLNNTHNIIICMFSGKFYLHSLNIEKVLTSHSQALIEFNAQQVIHI